MANTGVLSIHPVERQHLLGRGAVERVDLGELLLGRGLDELEQLGVESRRELLEALGRDERGRSDGCLFASIEVGAVVRGRRPLEDASGLGLALQVEGELLALQTEVDELLDLGNCSAFVLGIGRVFFQSTPSVSRAFA